MIMPVDGISPTAVALPALNFAYRTFQTGFELAAVPQQTRDLLDTISQVTADVKHAKALRRRKSRLLDQEEKETIDRTIQNTEKALAGLEALVEQPRVDMITNADRIGIRSRVMWTMRDATSVPVALARLGVMIGALNREIVIMRGREDRGFDGDMLGKDSKAPPPPYQAIRKTLHLRRQSTKKSPTLPVSPVEQLSPMTEIDPRNSWTGGMSHPWSSVSNSEGILSPVSQLDRNLLSPASQPERDQLSPVPEVDGPLISAPSNPETATRSTPPPLRPHERTDEQHFGSIRELVTVGAASRSEPTIMPSRLFRSSPRSFKWNDPSDFNRIASPLASDDGGSRMSSPQSLRRSRSQSWLAFQASRPMSPAISLACAQ